VRDYLVIFEQGKDGGWGAYAPDLPGLGVGAETRVEAEKLIREGIELYVSELRADGLPIPEPTSFPETISVAA
jgi:predicted RNase H-like HicB family nuclease